MKKLLLTLLCMLFAVQAFAQAAEEAAAETEKADAPKEQTSDVKTKSKGKPDFNKKKNLS